MRIPPVLLSTALSFALIAAAAAPFRALAQTATDSPAQLASPAITCKDDRKVDADKMIAACSAVIDNASATPADRLNARRPGAEIIKRRDEFDAVALQPSDGCGGIVRQGAKIADIALPAANPEHVVGKTGIDPVRCIEPHV